VVSTPPHFRVGEGSRYHEGTNSSFDEGAVRDGPTGANRRTAQRRQCGPHQHIDWHIQHRHCLDPGVSACKQVCMPANSHTELVTIYGYYILKGRKGKSLYLHVMKAYKGSTSIRSFIHNLGTRWRLAFSLTFRLLYPWERTPSTHRAAGCFKAGPVLD